MGNESSANLRHPESPQNPPKPGGFLRSRLAAFYQRHERYAGIAVFGLGFLWDSLTLTRVEGKPRGGRVLGRIDFTVIAGSSPHPPLVTGLIR